MDELTVGQALTRLVLLVEWMVRETFPVLLKFLSRRLLVMSAAVWLWDKGVIAGMPSELLEWLGGTVAAYVSIETVADGVKAVKGKK